MVIEQQITGAVIAGIKALYGADVTATQIQLQKTKREFKGHLTLVVFPFLRISKKSPEATGLEIGEYLLQSEPAIADDYVVNGFGYLTFAVRHSRAGSLRHHTCDRSVAFDHDRILIPQYQQAAPPGPRTEQPVRL